MNWTTFLSTLLGGLLALGGSWLGHWWNERRAIEREVRNRDHEREVWARELRREAHVHFLSEFDTKYRIAMDHEAFPGPEEPPEDWLSTLWSNIQSMRLVSNDETIEKAQNAIRELNTYVFHDGQWEQVDYALDMYIGEIRKEFNLPPISLMGD